MPIAQERMIALVEACKDYMGAIEVMRRKFERAFGLIEQGKSTPIIELNQLYAACIPTGLLTNFARSNLTIQLENKHWNERASKNLRERKRLAKKRKEEVGEGANAPRKLHFEPEANPQSLVARLDSEEEMDLDPAELIGAGEGLDAEKKIELDREVEEALKKMGSK